MESFFLFVILVFWFVVFIIGLDYLFFISIVYLFLFKFWDVIGGLWEKLGGIKEFRVRCLGWRSVSF